MPDHTYGDDYEHARFEAWRRLTEANDTLNLRVRRQLADEARTYAMLADAAAEMTSAHEMMIHNALASEDDI